MTEETKKKAPVKKAATPKVEKPSVKVAAQMPVKKEAPAKEAKAAKSGATITIMQVGSPIARQGYQRATLIGLGLNKLNRTRTLEDTPSVRGMIAKVKHLVEVVK